MNDLPVVVNLHHVCGHLQLFCTSRPFSYRFPSAFINHHLLRLSPDLFQMLELAFGDRRYVLAIESPNFKLLVLAAG